MQTMTKAPVGKRRPESATRAENSVKRTDVPQEERPQGRPEADDSEAAAATYSAYASRIPQVAAVVTVPSEHGIAVWTLLDHDQHGIARQAVYKLELVSLQDYPDALLDFRAINADDFPAERRDSLLPTGARELYRRPEAVAPPAEPAEPAVAVDAG